MGANDETGVLFPLQEVAEVCTASRGLKSQARLDSENPLRQSQFSFSRHARAWLRSDSLESGGSPCGSKR